MMDNNILISQLSSFANCSTEEASMCVKSLVEWITDSIIAEGQLTISGFGKFHVEKHMEYIQIDASSGKKYLIPPSLYLSFKPDPLLDNEDKSKAVTFPTIASVLAAKNKILPLQAEKMAVGFFKFALIQMEERKPVAIDGLGEFVLTKVEVEDKVYGKITYIADKLLSEKINRPFSYFFPVELRDGVSFDDIETKGTDTFSQPLSNDDTFLISDSSQSEQFQEADKQDSDIINDNNEAITTDTTEAEKSEDHEKVDGQINGLSESAYKTDSGEHGSYEEQEIPDNSSNGKSGLGNGNLKRLAIAAGICALLIAGILLWNNSGKEQPSVTLATDTTAQQVVEAKQDSLPEQQESIAASEQAEKTPVDNYAELNAKIPYGAYDIVGVQAEIIAPPGMDMATISRVYMGSDSPIYLVVMNGGETNPEPGSRIIIPKWRERTVRK